MNASLILALLAFVAMLPKAHAQDFWLNGQVGNWGDRVHSELFRATFMSNGGITQCKNLAAERGYDSFFALNQSGNMACVFFTKDKMKARDIVIGFEVIPEENVVNYGGPLSYIMPGTVGDYFGASELEPAGSFGDPHFKTWLGHDYDFHGVCDLVLLQEPDFAHGLGLEIHIRTRARYQYSYIESAAIKIGDDVLEVGSWAEYNFNGVEGVRFPTTMGGLFTVTYVEENKKRKHFEIALDHMTKIKIGCFKDLVSVALDRGSHNEYFQGSVGLLGSTINGQMLARDGVTVLESDPVAFGKEWQVRDTEPSLFQNMDRFPQFPEACVMPAANAAMESGRL